MAGNSIEADLLGRIKTRAADAGRCSDTNAMAANSVSLESLLDSGPKTQDPQVLAYLEGVNSPLKSMMVGHALGESGPARALVGALSGLLGGKGLFGMMGGTSFSMGGGNGAPAVREPASEAAVQAAEAALGFALPDGLRQLYIEVSDGGFGPGEGIYSLDQLVAKHREMTSEPAGPQEQDWPAHLLPIHGANWDLIAIDRSSGRLIYWDAETLDSEDEDPGDVAWNASFVEEAPGLGAWLETWLGAPTQAETMAQMREEAIAAQTGYASDESIEAFRADNPEYVRRTAIYSMTPEERAAIGLPATGWESKVWDGFDYNSIKRR